MTADDIATARKLIAEATPGPWLPALGSGASLMTALVGSRGDESEFVADFLPDWALDNCALPGDHRNNMDAVAWLMTNATALLDALEAERRDAEDVRGQRDAAVRCVRTVRVLSQNALDTGSRDTTDWREDMIDIVQLCDAVDELAQLELSREGGE